MLKPWQNKRQGETRSAHIPSVLINLVEEVLSAFCIESIIITEHTWVKAVGSGLLGYTEDEHSLLHSVALPPCPESSMWFCYRK